MIAEGPIAEPPVAEPWHTWSTEDALARTGSAVTGLSAEEAARRLAADGPNALTEGARVSPFRLFLGQFASLIIWLLIAAGVLSGLLGEVVDAIAILGIVLVNAGVGFYQEFGAERAIAALRTMTAAQAKVRRDGQVMLVPATAVVAGDVLALEAGDLVPADARLFVAASLRCIESALTGESEAVTKSTAALKGTDVPLGDRANMVFMGTGVAAGSGQAVVVGTGMTTELGRIAGLLTDAAGDASTPLQHKLDAVGRILVRAALGIVVVLFGIGWLRGTPWLELLLTSISLAVAAVPEGLPAVVTVALSVGVQRMARRRALVRRLAAVETLGSAGVICTDKTGTLTVGAMSTRALYVAGQRYEVTGEGYGPDGEVRVDGVKVGAPHGAPLLELATVLVGCNNAHLVQEDSAWIVIGDPTEGALLAGGVKAGGDQARLDQVWPRHHEIPFDSDRKRSATVRRKPDGTLRALVNGAPAELLERCTHEYTAAGVRPLDDAARAQIVEQTTTMASEALRVLGSAYRDVPPTPLDNLTADAVERDLVFVGLTGMHDPPRPESRDAIARCRAAGIRVVMITGDHPRTAAAIGAALGIAPADGDAVVTGVELDAMPDEELRRRVPDVAVYARVTAEHKLRIVRALKATAAVVAMTGDGVNDAPAIKGADIGIAMGRTGTEVTKQAADMIVTDDNFAMIVAAVEEGRGIFDNIRKTLQYLLAGNTGELLLMTVAVVAGLPAPLLPIHLLWVNLVTDGVPALCLATDPIDPDVMTRPPRGREERMTDGRFLWTMVLTGVLTAGVALAVYVYMLQRSPTDVARTYAFTVLVFAELLRSFGARSESKPVWRISLLTNVKLVVVVALSFALQVWSQHNAALGRALKTTPMSFADCLVLLALGAIPLAVLEVMKLVRRPVRTARAATSPA